MKLHFPPKAKFCVPRAHKNFAMAPLNDLNIHDGTCSLRKESRFVQWLLSYSLLIWKDASRSFMRSLGWPRILFAIRVTCCEKIAVWINTDVSATDLIIKVSIKELFFSLSWFGLVPWPHCLIERLWNDSHLFLLNWLLLILLECCEFWSSKVVLWKRVDDRALPIIKFSHKPICCRIGDLGAEFFAYLR